MRIEEIKNFLPEAAQISKLTGDASAREYYRVALQDGTTRIVMKLPVGPSSKAEEITKTTKQISELPFINIQKYLRANHLPVPDIMATHLAQGILVLSDLGDQTLYEALQKGNAGLTLFFYQRAIHLLHRLQKACFPSQDCIAFHRSFDEDLLNWEFDHFLEYGIEDRLQIKVNSVEKKNFETITRSISKKIAAQAKGFVHRDFQSRNLMLHEYDLWVIDFQDALKGPCLYDLVALLRDSYVVLRSDQIQSLHETYLNGLEKNHPYFGRREILVGDFDLITIQRKLKDAGRFQFIHTVKKNSSFLKYVPTSLSYVREALERQPSCSELSALLSKYLPEFS